MREGSTTIELKNDLSELTRLAQVLKEFGEVHHLPQKLVHLINITLDEVVTNIISYGFEESGPHTIVVRLLKNEDRITAEVEDDARPFNPLEHPQPNTGLPLEERKIGGLGIHFVRKMMDDVTYRWQDGKNLLVLQKNITS